MRVRALRLGVVRASEGEGARLPIDRDVLGWLYVVLSDNFVPYDISPP